jgi:hypothetical protein
MRHASLAHCPTSCCCCVAAACRQCCCRLRQELGERWAPLPRSRARRAIAATHSVFVPLLLGGRAAGVYHECAAQQTSACNAAAKSRGSQLRCSLHFLGCCTCSAVSERIRLLVTLRPAFGDSTGGRQGCWRKTCSAACPGIPMQIGHVMGVIQQPSKLNMPLHALISTTGTSPARCTPAAPAAHVEAALVPRREGALLERHRG